MMITPLAALAPLASRRATSPVAPAASSESFVASHPNYLRLSPEQRTTFDRLERSRGALTDVDDNMRKLLDSGRLTAVDSQGVSTLEHLDGFRTDRRFPELVRLLAEPGRSRQDGRGSCGAASVQYLHATQRPADFARVTVGLAQHGGARLENGDWLPANGSSRGGCLDRLYQGAMMDYCNGDLGYDDNYRQNGCLGVSTRDGRIVQQGLSSTQVQAGVSAVMGTDYHASSSLQNLGRELGTRGTVLASLHWGEAGHAVVIERVENGQVYLRNPQGELNDPHAGPPRQELDPATGRFRMSWADFSENLEFIVQKDDRGPLKRAWDRVFG